MNLFQRSGSGVDLEPLINDDMGLPLVQMRHATDKPRMKPVTLREPKAWQCGQGRGPFVTYSEEPKMSPVYRRFITCLVVILLVVLAINTFATAQAQTVGLHVASVHVPSRDGYNNANVGAFYRHDNGLMAGVYHNSLGRTSVYGAYQFPVGPIDIAVGMVSGYKQECWKERHSSTELFKGGVVVTKSWSEWKCKGTGRHEWMPMVVPSYRFGEVLGVHPRLSVVLGERTTALHLSIERDL